MNTNITQGHVAPENRMRIVRSSMVHSTQERRAFTSILPKDIPLDILRSIDRLSEYVANEQNKCRLETYLVTAGETEDEAHKAIQSLQEGAQKIAKIDVLRAITP